MEGITWIKERKGHYSCEEWSVTYEPDANTINAPNYIIRRNGREEGRSQTLRQALTKAGLMFGNATAARLAATGPFPTRSQVNAVSSAQMQ